MILKGNNIKLPNDFHWPLGATLKLQTCSNSNTKNQMTASIASEKIIIKRHTRSTDVQSPVFKSHAALACKKPCSEKRPAERSNDNLHYSAKKQILFTKQFAQQRYWPTVIASFVVLAALLLLPTFHSTANPCI